MKPPAFILSDGMCTNLLSHLNMDGLFTKTAHHPTPAVDRLLKQWAVAPTAEQHSNKDLLQLSGY